MRQVRHARVKSDGELWSAHVPFERKQNSLLGGDSHATYWNEKIGWWGLCYGIPAWMLHFTWSYEGGACYGNPGA